MHILQTARNPSQLNYASASLSQSQVTTYKFNAIHVLVFLNELVDVSIFHPIGNHTKPVFGQYHSKQR